ncbi:unnamed protein product [Vitrella brassicaformis CCMP3155]|uniref:non-specific serine/threonine protein kinase n=2 Tax=Vitrella brassicaformis TaxID=1169539 RepID=A0A0G4ESK1_VITBC|nr:unnamed protein product [Vitrella brassicaformis CCMP3155]|mmetsp:Transcript_12246/g.29324  ORF Transcript_12246/g.29324 Transcript_12246/m.29324 type:complete len:272 (+) Transcript_12246:60-875(+)|eukprot:CEM00893.1 unnamed protein product [Vitrella brassicaformis CCMP3155]
MAQSKTSHEFLAQNKYIIMHQLGAGCFGKVFKARRRYTGQIVALKFIPKRGKTDRDLSSLRQEINILKRLRHDNIILMLDSFETAEEICVVTEFAQGELFDVFRDEKKLPENEVRWIASQLVSALHYLHRNRIIHRDLKPQNILVGANRVVKVCDFGFARALSDQTHCLHSIKGTPLYMAPELVQEKSYDVKADLWSLGVIVYELYVGKPPFYTQSLYSLIHMIVQNPVTYPQTMSPTFRSFLDAILQKDPTNRLPTEQLAKHPFIATHAR